MSGVEPEEGPRFGPLRPDRRAAIRPDEPGQGAAGGRDPAASLGPNLGSVAAWLAGGIASVVAVALLLMTWSSSGNSDSQLRNSGLVVAGWLAVVVVVVARDHGRALRVFNVLALLAALLFIAIVVLALYQFVRLAGES